MTPNAEKFASDGERSSQMLSSGCALQIQIDRFRSKTDIGLGELLDMPFERHEGLGQQHDICNKARIVANKLAVAVGDCLAWIARLVTQSQLSFTRWKRAPASCKGSVVGMPVGNASPAISGPLKPSIAFPARLGNAIILVFAVVFGGWGYFAPLDGGAVAPGVINPDSGKKTIQHLEGGIIAEMRVREGEAVAVGQPLVVLESTQARAAYDSLAQQRWSLLAKKARLEAESAGQNQIDLPPELISTDRRIRSVVEAQQEVFDARRLTYATRKNVLGQRSEQLTQQINGNEAQVESASRQIDFVSEELRAKEYLVGRGLMAKPEALRLKRVEAELSGKRGEYLATIARLHQQIGETSLQIVSVDAERADQVATDAEKVRADLTEVTEKLHASADILQRTVVVAPVSGTVVDVKFRTVGGVVQRGEPIMSIVPSGDELMIEGRLTPMDRKAVHAGLQAQIHLSAYSSRLVPKIPGTVQTVSADRLIDDTTHQPYYLARVAVDRHTLERLAPNVDLIPGMPVEVLIVTERRTMFDYIFKPFHDAFWRSFREI
jgi:HlyD family secretion protein/epimerase transport system membrane fusion protein